MSESKRVRSAIYGIKKELDKCSLDFLNTIVNKNGKIDMAMLLLYFKYQISFDYSEWESGLIIYICERLNNLQDSSKIIRVSLHKGTKCDTVLKSCLSY